MCTVRQSQNCYWRHTATQFFKNFFVKKKTEKKEEEEEEEMIFFVST